MSRIIPAPIIGQSAASGAQVIDGSLKFDGSQELTFTPGSDGNLKTATWSFWVKRTKLSSGNDTIFGFGPDAANDAQIYFNSSDKIYIFFRKSSSSQITYQTTRVFRDTGWYHIVMSVDTTQASGQVQLYVNGTEVTAWDNNTDTTQNADLIINDATFTNYIGRGRGNVSVDLDCMLSNVYLIDGQALGPEYFGYTDPLTNTWRPKKFSAFNNPNNGTTYSSDITGTPLNSTVAQAFDGSLTTGAEPDSLLTYTPTTTITAQSQIRLYIYQNGYASQYGTFEHNGTNLATSIASQLGDGVAGWYTLPSNTITQLKWSRTSGVGSWRLRAIEVDGYVLINGAVDNSFYLPLDGNTPIGQDQSGRGNNWTPVNFGGSNSIEKATGAFPILNTVSGGNYATVGVRTDSSYDNLILALPYAGNAADVTTSIGSTTTSLMTSWSQNSSSFQDGGGFYNSALFMNSTSDYPRINFSAGAMNFMHNSTGTGTIEFWANSSSVTTGAIWASTSGGSNEVGFGFYSFTNGTEIGFFISKGVAGQSSSAATGKTPNGKWVHIAGVKTPTELRLYTDGVLRSKVDISSYAFSDSNSTRNYIQHGSPPQQSGTRGWTGAYMQDFRVYEGLEKYTGDFVVASTNPDILPDTPSGVAGGSALTKITDGAVSFDGTGDYLEVTPTSTLADTAGTYTIEFFFNMGSARLSDNVYNHFFTTSSGVTIAKWRSGVSNKVYFESEGSQTGWVVETIDNIAANRWYHYAAVRNGNTISVYLDGKLQGTTTSSYTSSAETYWRIGNGASNTSQGHIGQISNFRIIDGTALYTSDFTPPSAPLTNVTNTSLLCCQSNTSANSVEVIPGTFSNSGTTYSSNLSGSIASSPYDATKMFDGNISTFTDHSTINSTITWTQTLTGVTSLRVYIHGGNSTNTVTTVGDSGTQTDTISTDFGPGWHNIVLGTTGSTINSIAFTRGGSGNFLSIYAVEVNGTVLIDNFYGKAIARAGNTSATNFNPFATDINTVRGQETGYCTLNPLRSGMTLSNGNLRATSSSSYAACTATIGVSTGKFYYETLIEDAGGTAAAIGVGTKDTVPTTYLGARTYDFGYNSTIIYGNDGTLQTGLPSLDAGDTVGVAMNLDNSVTTFYKNGVFVTTQNMTSGIEYYPALGDNSSGGQPILSANFGQKPFKFPPPEGFQPLNAVNVRPSTVIARPDQYVDVATWTGDNTENRLIPLNMKPDLIWIKQRNDTRVHILQDSVRGFTKGLYSNDTVAESTRDPGYGEAVPGGFEVSSGAGSNVSGRTMVAWNWKAGGNKNTFNVDDVGYASAAAAGLTAGTITPTGASVNTKSGFSIISFNSQSSDGNYSLSHGLNNTPKFIIMKSRTRSGGPWWVYHASTTDVVYKYLMLNSTIATTDNVAAGGGNIWGSSLPTSTTFGFTTGAGTAHTQNEDVIAYLWADVPGLQKFGSYAGNSSADGPFIELGFKPALIILKKIDNVDSNSGWHMYDNQRNTYNATNNFLLAGHPYYENRAANNTADVTTYTVDFLSNGFKLRHDSNNLNTSGSTYIYAAWAEAPSFNLYGAQSNAR